MDRLPAIGILASCTLAFASCTPHEDASGTDSSGVMTVMARGLSFEAPDTVSAGWVTIRFRNEAPLTHFALVERLPDSVGAREQQAQVAPVFQQGMDLLAAGQPDSAMAAFGHLPAWFGQVVFLGGPGLTAPGRTSETTVHLDPGTYLLECYVKSGGTFHSFNRDTTAWGMVHQFTVTGPPSSAAEPTADLHLTISSDSGIRMAGQPTPGRAIVAVSFLDQHPHENFVGHDVHLLKVGQETDLDSVAVWMDWSHPGELDTPAPATFLGGVNEMPAGSTGYLTVDLEKGRYAWVAEVPHVKEKHMLVPFTVD
jgi:hypothetical protein